MYTEKEVREMDLYEISNARRDSLSFLIDTLLQNIDISYASYDMLENMIVDVLDYIEEIEEEIISRGYWIESALKVGDLMEVFGNDIIDLGRIDKWIRRDK